MSDPVTKEKGLRPLRADPTKIAAQVAHSLYHILDDYAAEDAQTGEVTVEIPAFAWKELNELMDKLGADPHEVLHDLIGVNS